MSGIDNEFYQEEDEEETEEVEAYCVRCREMVVMESPQPVWTQRGAPGTRGVCPLCGTITFRMGHTPAHAHLRRPKVNGILALTRESERGVQGQITVYLNYSQADTEFAALLASDLTKNGVTTWSEPVIRPDDGVWAAGVHPALETCSHMVVVLSSTAIAAQGVIWAWNFFRQRRKPVLVALAAVCSVPDELSHRPRFNFADDYRVAFRQLVQALTL